MTGRTFHVEHEIGRGLDEIRQDGRRYGWAARGGEGELGNCGDVSYGRVIRVAHHGGMVKADAAIVITVRLQSVCRDKKRSDRAG